MAKEKACKNCKLIYEGDVCPSCEKKETSDTFKGKVEIVNPEKSELSEANCPPPGIGHSLFHRQNA